MRSARSVEKMRWLWTLLVIPLVVGAERELRIDKYVVKIEGKTLRRIHPNPGASDSIDLSGLQLDSLEKNAFDDVANLKSLNLGNNSLTRLPEFVFANLTNLEDLSLADNRISELENVFVGLNNVTRLDISNNPIRFLKKGHFFGLTEKSRVFTRGISLLGVSAALFENPFLREEKKPEENKKEAKNGEESAKAKSQNAGIKVCMAEGNLKLVERFQLDEPLTRDCLRIKPKGTKLTLDKLDVFELTKGWYRLGDSSIDTLSLADNRISRLTGDILNDLPKEIKFIDLSGNLIKNIERGVIKNEEISRLDLSNNQIDRVDEEAFEGTKLRELLLRNNKLRDAKFALPLKNLELLNLEANELESISSSCFSKDNKLRKLLLGGNKISELGEKALSELECLEELDLSSNKVEKLNGSFLGLKKLRNLNLHNNSLKDIPRNAFGGLERLEALNLGRNELTKVSEELRPSLPVTLKRLRLDYNEIESLPPGSFIGVPLEALSLNGNKISTVEKDAFDLPSLLTLRLDKNMLREIDGDAFAGLRSLKYLVLEENGLEKIEKGFAKNLPNLESLNLSRNPIEKLEDGALFGLPKSPDCYVYLVGVPLRIIEGGAFENL